MIFPRNLISFWKRLHFFSFSFKLYFLNLSSTVVKLFRWSSQFLPNTMTSSKYARHSIQVNPFSTSCINLLNVAGLLQKPKLIGIGLIASGTYVQINLKGYSSIIGGQFSAAAVFFIILGVLIFMIAAFGCCGAYKENYCCIMIFAVILIIIFICELAAGISGFIYKDKVDKEVRLDD